MITRPFLTLSRLSRLGYPSSEAKWIYETFSQIQTDHGHTWATKMYTDTIVDVITQKGPKSWAKYHVHLPYDIMLEKFYLQGFNALGNGLLRHSFYSSEEYAKLVEFKRRFKADPKNPHTYVDLLRIVDREL